MKYYLVVGEASGDMHAANLIKAIRAKDAQAEFRFLGGDKMQAAAETLASKHIRELAFMGFLEVIKHLPTIFSNLSLCKKDIRNFNPDAVILVDYPGFNFRLFSFLQEHKFKTVYYISPQLWAWKKGRVKQIKKFVDRLYVILPFEVSFYEKNGIKAHYFGHPMLDEIDVNSILRAVRDEKKIAVLPGSRKQEISYLLPEYLKVAKHFPDYKFKVAALNLNGEKFYHQFALPENVELVFDKTYEVLQTSSVGIITSGTATLETALFGVPQVICYKGSWISYQIAKRLIKGIDFIGIVNLIAGKKVVEELIQDDVNEIRLVSELKNLLQIETQNRIQNDYEELYKLLGNSGSSQRMAEDLIAYLK
ncbi:MAG TPA: lipid-A-disaccharide synthase [Chitinophagales bacterium]